MRPVRHANFIRAFLVGFASTGGFSFTVTDDIEWDAATDFPEYTGLLARFFILRHSRRF